MAAFIAKVGTSGASFCLKRYTVNQSVKHPRIRLLWCWMPRGIAQESERVL